MGATCESGPWDMNYSYVVNLRPPGGPGNYVITATPTGAHDICASPNGMLGYCYKHCSLSLQGYIVRNQIIRDEGSSELICSVRPGRLSACL